MSRYILIIIILGIVNYLAYGYLIDSLMSQKEYPFISVSRPIVVKNKQFGLYNIDDFIFEDYFDVFCIDDYSYQYSFDEDYLNITIHTHNEDYEYRYPYTILEKEVIKEIVYVEKPQKNNTVNAGNTPSKPSIEKTENKTAQSSFSLLNSSLTFGLNTDISTVISGISSSFTASEYVALDYTQLNTSAYGSYPVYLYPNSGGTYCIWINIQ